MKLECQKKKIGREKYFFGMIFATAQDLLQLPLWQILPVFCHFGWLSAISSADRIG
jgi:hypothetical protein